MLGLVLKGEHRDVQADLWARLLTPYRAQPQVHLKGMTQTFLELSRDSCRIDERPSGNFPEDC
jgi:hypothetical protein